MNKKKWIKDYLWSNNEIDFINKYQYLTAKPIVYLINLS